jgi:hypothetical protein
VAGLAIRSPARLRAASRFGAPLAEDAVACVDVQTTEYMGRFDPVNWLVQRRVGRCSRKPDLTAELDRFVAHWSYRRDLPNAWMEVDRNEAVDLIVALQRTSLVWGPHRDRNLNNARARSMPVSWRSIPGMPASGGTPRATATHPSACRLEARRASPIGVLLQFARLLNNTDRRERAPSQTRPPHRSPDH